jgi:hypothetical protein
MIQKVYIIGGNVPVELQALHSDKFQILGYQKDIDDYFTKSKALLHHYVMEQV